MNAIYQSVGISKQAFHQHLDSALKCLEEQHQLLPVVAQVRKDHPRMSAREMYRMLHPENIGRDRFIALCFANGYKVERKRNLHRTTDSRGVRRFPNLIIELELTGVNQAWVSDITYYRIQETFYYLTFITDLYSRRIVGYSGADNLMTVHTTLPALKMALRQRKPPKGLILHSDGGGQYYSKTFLKLTEKYDVRNSMGETVYENPHAERLNGIIKNDYLIPYNPQHFNQLQQMLKKAVDMYNLQRPHKALNGSAPENFEKLLTKNEVIDKRKKEAKKRKMMMMNNELNITQK